MRRERVSVSAGLTSTKGAFPSKPTAERSATPDLFCGGRSGAALRSALGLEGFSTEQRRGSLRSHTDHADRRADELLEATHVLLGLARQVVPPADLREVLLPSRQRLVDRLHLRHGVHVRPEVVEPAAVDVVSRADADV